MKHYSKVIFLVMLFLHSSHEKGSKPQDLIALEGESIQLNCKVPFPSSQLYPYAFQWTKQEGHSLIFSWLALSRTNQKNLEPCPEDFVDRRKNRCRISVIQNEVRNGGGDVSTEMGGGDGGGDLSTQKGGLASLQILDVKEVDQGWYACKVARPVEEDKGSNRFPNGTYRWIHLDVRHPPKFIVTPSAEIFIEVGDKFILKCQASGDPKPKIVWHLGDRPVRVSNHVKIANLGTELRVMGAEKSDMGEYACFARNEEGSIHHVTKVNKKVTSADLYETVVEGDTARINCGDTEIDENLSLSWYRKDKEIQSVGSMKGRVSVKSNGMLVINPVRQQDADKYACYWSGGIKSTTKLIVEYPARVSSNSSVQILPLGRDGIIFCPVEANPPIQFVTWLKDKRIFDPFDQYDNPSMSVMSGLTRGSGMWIKKVTRAHAGIYTCSPYNKHGTQGPSPAIEVIVMDPPHHPGTSPAPQPTPSCPQVAPPCPQLTLPCPQNAQFSSSWEIGASEMKIETYKGTLTVLGQKENDASDCLVLKKSATWSKVTTLSLTNSKSSKWHLEMRWVPQEKYTQLKYKIRYREKASSASNWILLPLGQSIEGAAHQTQIHNLGLGKTYEFQILRSDHAEMKHERVTSSYPGHKLIGGSVQVFILICWLLFFCKEC